MIFQNTFTFPHIWLVHEGKKTQTRRVIPQNKIEVDGRVPVPYGLKEEIPVTLQRGGDMLFKLKAKTVPIEQLTDITEADAKLEGFISIADYLSAFAVINYNSIPKVIVNAYAKNGKTFEDNAIEIAKAWNPLVYTYKGLELIPGSETGYWDWLVKNNKVVKRDGVEYGKTN
jgi:hypothetical protein